MTLDSLIMFGGAFVATLPFLGLPNTWDSALFVVFGLFIIALGIVVRRREKDTGTIEAQSEHYAEQAPRPQVNQHVESHS